MKTNKKLKLVIGLGVGLGLSGAAVTGFAINFGNFKMPKNVQQGLVAGTETAVLCTALTGTSQGQVTKCAEAGVGAGVITATQQSRNPR